MPYTSTVTPSSTYLPNPLNAYTHLGMPKSFVHLVGPPLTLDSCITGDKGRFIRSGCRPDPTSVNVDLCKPWLGSPIGINGLAL
ncbi:hypothetical protein BD779DRAFT_1565900 [Infundibulicybe gibba]|nr:hypothetical protein BD779DRAFT_1565900 [Infundibulicybe gibba]